jgi:hypothetical protein
VSGFEGRIIGRCRDPFFRESLYQCWVAQRRVIRTVQSDDLIHVEPLELTIERFHLDVDADPFFAVILGAARPHVFARPAHEDRRPTEFGCLPISGPTISVGHCRLGPVCIERRFCFLTRAAFKLLPIDTMPGKTVGLDGSLSCMLRGYYGFGSLTTIARTTAGEGSAAEQTADQQGQNRCAVRSTGQGRSHNMSVSKTIFARRRAMKWHETRYPTILICRPRLATAKLAELRAWYDFPGRLFPRG